MDKIKESSRKILLLTATNSKREVEEMGKISEERGISFSAYLNEGKELKFFPQKENFYPKDFFLENLKQYDVVIACCDATVGYTVPGWISFICGYCFERKIPVIGYICNSNLYGKKLPPSLIYEAQDQAEQIVSSEYVNFMIQESCIAFLTGNFITVLNYLEKHKEPIKAKNFLKTAERNGDGIYLAGPDIFRKDKIYHCSLQKTILIQHGLQPEHPLDNSLLTDTSPWEIFLADVEQINRCEAIFANLQPYAGKEPDDGTLFEIGYGIAKGLTVYVYPGKLTANKEVFLSEEAKVIITEMLKKLNAELPKEYIDLQSEFKEYGCLLNFVWDVVFIMDSLNMCCQKFLAIERS